MPVPGADDGAVVIDAQEEGAAVAVSQANDRLDQLVVVDVPFELPTQPLALIRQAADLVRGHATCFEGWTLRIDRTLADPAKTLGDPQSGEPAGRCSTGRRWNCSDSLRL